MTEAQLQLLGLGADATEDQITAALQRLRGIEVDVALSAAEGKGLVTAENKEVMRAAATANLATFSAIVAATPAPAPAPVEPKTSRAKSNDPRPSS